MDSLSDELDVLKVRKVRAGAKTYTQLDLGHQNLSADLLEQPPTPEETLDVYTTERLKRGLRHAMIRLTRDLTPRTRSFLEMYKAAYQKAIDRGEEDEQQHQRHVVAVLTYDRLYHSNAFLKHDLTSAEAKRVTAIRKVRELEILCKYGDYVGHEVQSLRKNIYKQQADSGDEIELAAARPLLSSQQMWTEIAQILETEKDDIDRWMTYPEVDAVEHFVTVALRNACRILGYDFDHMYWAIQEYARRNRTFHNNINEPINRCQWSALANQIHADLRDLPLTLSFAEAAPWRLSMITLRDKYLIVHDRDDPSTWTATPEANRLSDAKSASVRARLENSKRRHESSSGGTPSRDWDTGRRMQDGSSESEGGEGDKMPANTAKKVKTETETSGEGEEDEDEQGKEEDKLLQLQVEPVPSSSSAAQ